jgi:hypothetical protein
MDLLTVDCRDHVYLLSELMPGGELTDVLGRLGKPVKIRVKEHWWQVNIHPSSD